MFERYYSIIIVLLFSFVSGFALLHAGLPPTHDGEYHVIRFYEFDKMVRTGILYPRWAPDLNNGYGVPLFNYVYPLPNYVALLLHLAGISFIDAFKISLFLATVIGAVGMYFWSKAFWGEKGGVVSSVFYSFAPYRFVDTYIRGSIGEVWALAFFPWFLWAVTEYYKTRTYRYFFLSAILLGLIIFSHNILALMFFCFAIAYMLILFFYQKQPVKMLLKSLAILIAGLLVSSIFWIPALVEKEYVVGLQIFEIGKNFPELYQLIIPSWGSGFSAGDLQNQMSYQLGVGNILVSILSIVLVIRYKKKKDKKSILILTFLVLLFITILLMLRYSLLLWGALPFLQYFQFPWRLLSLVIVICSFLAGAAISIWKEKYMQFILIFLVVIFGIGYARPDHYLYRNDSYYETRSNFIDGTNSPGNVFNTKWLPVIPQKVDKRVDFTSGKVKSTQHNFTEYTFATQSLSEGTLYVNLAYFPGWVSSIDNGLSEVHNADGKLAIHVPKGKHTIHLQFADTIVRSIGKYMTIIAFLLLLLPLLFTSKQPKTTKRS